MVGGDLSAADAWTLSLLTNPEVIAVDQHSSGNHPVMNTDKINTDKTVVWLAQSTSENAQYLAVFNRSESSAVVRYEWKDLGLAGKRYELRDLWEHKDLGPASALTATLPTHGSLLYRLVPFPTAGASN
jgi:alpha-galactosidase